MRKYQPLILSALFLIIFCPITSVAQQTSIEHYVLFGGNGNCPSALQTTPAAPGCGVQIGAGTNIISGKIGSYKLVKTIGATTLNSDVFSGEKIELFSSNIVTGNLAAANTSNAQGTIVQLGSGGNISGDVHVNGNTVNAGTVIQGQVVHPTGTTYTGVAPGSGDLIGNPVLPELPGMPAITNFPAAGATSITGNATIIPGTFDKILLTGNKTVTFSGVGTYVFNSIKNAGAVNTFIFDFQGNTTGVFRLYIHGDVDLNKSNVEIINGGSPNRIYAETHGDGSSSDNGTSAWYIANGSGSSNVQISAWAGTIWAPYAGIYVGNQTSTSRLRGALWSATQVNLIGGVIIEHHPFVSLPSPNIFPYYPPPNNYKVNTIIGSELTSLYNNSTSTSSQFSDIFVLRPDSVWIEVIAIKGQRSALAALLTNSTYGLTDTIPNGDTSLIITGKYKISKLLLLNDLTSMISFCRPVFPAISSSGIAQTLGDSSMRTNYVRNGFNIKGDSIRIGVLSDSYNTLINNPAAQDRANDDLPGRVGNPVNADTVRVLKEYPYGRKSDEGRAMLQIIHDVAPKAKLSFRSGFLTSGDFAQGIRELAADSCKIIVDDITYITEPFFKPGVVEKAIQQVSAAGVHYVTAAGNFGEKSYESIFNPAPAPAGLTGNAHNFGGGDILQNDSIKGSVLTPGNYTIVLQWIDDFYSLGGNDNGTVNDLDIYLADNLGNPLFGFNRNNIGGDPIEVLPFTVTANTATNILIINASSQPTSNLRFKYVVFRGDLKINEYVQGNSTIVGQANSPHAITVGAALYSNTPAFGVNPPTAASFSSTGGTTIGNTPRNKPDLVGPNGVNTTVNFGSIDYENDGLPNFFGTSAAAPHVAGAIALVLEAKWKYYGERMTPSAVKTLLQNTAINMYGAGFDFKSGFGFIQVDAAVRSFANPTPQIVKLELVDSTLTPGAQPMALRVIGTFMTPDSRIIFGNDTLVTTILNNETALGTIPSFTSNKTVYIYTPPKTPSLQDGGLSNGVQITGIQKKNITIIADNKTKKYGESLPAFTYTVLVNGDSLHRTTYTLAQLGLQNVTRYTLATASSNVGIYFIRPVRVFDSSAVADSLLLEQFNYAYSDGSLVITKLPVTINVRDTTLKYGEKIAGFNFDYSIDPTATILNASAFVNAMETAHTNQVESDVVGLVNAQAVVIVNGQAVPIVNVNGQAVVIVNGQAVPIVNVTIVNGQAVVIVNGQAVPIVNAQAVSIVNGQAVPIVNALTSAHTENLSFSATTSSLDNSRVVNTSEVVDITQESIIKFNVNTAQTLLTSAIANVNERGLLGVESIANGQAVVIVNQVMLNAQAVPIVNGQAVSIVNGQAVSIVNGQAVTIVNGQAVSIVNGHAVPIVNGESRTAAIIDTTDLRPSGIGSLRSINVITGLTVGTHTIIPATFINDNLSITYQTGVLTITPKEASVTADDKVMFQGDLVPPFTSTVTGFLPADIPTVSYSLSPAYLGSAGVYNIIPQIPASSSAVNYLITITNGKLYVNPKGNGAKKLRPYLDCIEVVAPVNGMGYIAKFYCINDNATPVYIPVGPDNKLTSSGLFVAGTQPTIFNPGITRFEVRFDGNNLKWELRTYETNRKTSTASVASSSSNKCNQITSLTSRGEDEVIANEIIADKSFKIYPNPVVDKVIIELGLNQKILTLTDVLGRVYNVTRKELSGSQVELDLTGLKPGVYFIKLQNGKTGRIIKE